MTCTVQSSVQSSQTPAAHLIDHVGQRVDSFGEHGCRACVEVGQQLDDHHHKVAAVAQLQRPQDKQHNTAQL